MDTESIVEKSDPIDLKKFNVYTTLRKLGILIAVAAVFVGVVHFTNIREILENTSWLKTTIRNQGAWGPFFFILGSSILVMIGMPRLLSYVVGGMAFGFVQGLIFAQVASLLGAYSTFLIARWGTREWVKRLIENKSRYYKIIENPNILTIFLARQLPSSSVFISLFLGFSPVRHLNFIIGSLLGFLPQGIPAALIGSGAGKSSTSMAFTQLLTAAAVLLLGGVIMLRLFAAYKRK